MARLHSDFLFSGTIGNLTIYQLGGKSFVRSKSSLDRKRFLKDPAFARSREKAALFGRAARLTKAFYGELPTDVKRHGLFGSLTAIAYKGLQEGKSAVTIIKELEEYCGITPPVPAKAVMTPAKQKQERKATLLSKWGVDRRGRLQISKERVDHMTIPEGSHKDTKAQRGTKKCKEERRE